MNIRTNEIQKSDKYASGKHVNLALEYNFLFLFHYILNTAKLCPAVKFQVVVFWGLKPRVVATHKTTT
jgi:hypothetical protein